MALEEEEEEFVVAVEEEEEAEEQRLPVSSRSRARWIRSGLLWRTFVRGATIEQHS